MKGKIEFENGRYEIRFPGKPDGRTIGRLKASGFWWDGRAGVWHLARAPLFDQKTGTLIGDPQRAALECVADLYDAADLEEANRRVDDYGHQQGARGMEIALGIA